MLNFIQDNCTNSSLTRNVPDLIYRPPTVGSLHAAFCFCSTLWNSTTNTGTATKSRKEWPTPTETHSWRASPSPTAQASHDPQQPIVDAVAQLGVSSPWYQQLIVNLSAELSCKDIPFWDIVDTLETILANGDAPHLFPASIGNFPSFCPHLHHQRMYHEMDLDLLCKLLEELELEDLKQHVHSYSREIMDNIYILK